MAAHLFIVLSVLLSVMVSPGFASEAFVGSVKKIIDGDSLLIVSANKTIEVPDSRQEQIAQLLKTNLK